MTTQRPTVEDGIFIICRDANTDIVVEHIVSENALGELSNLGESQKNQGERLRFLVVEESSTEEKKLERTKETIETKYREFEKKTMYSKDKKRRGRKSKIEKEEEM